MKVWVALIDYGYEPSILLGVYSSREKAIEREKSSKDSEYISVIEVELDQFYEKEELDR